MTVHPHKRLQSTYITTVNTIQNHGTCIAFSQESTRVKNIGKIKFNAKCSQHPDLWWSSERWLVESTVCMLQWKY